MTRAPAHEVTAARSSEPRPVICVFAKAPVPGQAKTRLAPALGAAGAARLAAAFFADTWRAVRALPWARPVVAAAGDPRRLALDDSAEVWPQGDGDLGARLERILGRALAEAPAALAIGTDSPGLPVERLAQARAALEHADAVLGPADDGGYYLLGLRRCPPGLLAGLPWSSPGTLAATRARLEARGLTVALLEPWFDVDEPRDLDRLEAHLATAPGAAPATAALLRPAISVVMPVLDEAARIERAISACRAIGLADLLVVDGGSGDDTAARARAAGARVLGAPRGRGPQMNAGAAAAGGDVLLFLHADVTLPPDAPRHIARALLDPAVVAGAFRTWTVADGDDRPWWHPLLHLADVRSRYTGLPYGDQAIFVRRAAFEAVGGYPAIPLMEDVELSRRLRRRGKIAIVDARVRVSGRRFLARPVAYTLAVNLFPLLHRAGVPPAVLARLYRPVRERRRG